MFQIFFLAFLFIMAPIDMSAADGRRLPQDPQQQNIRQRRLAALKAFGIDTTSIASLIKALQHERVGVQYGAIFLLQERKAQEAIPALKELLAVKTTPGLLKVECGNALIALGAEPDAWSVILASLLRDPDPMLRIRAAGLLARVKDPSGWYVIREFLRSEDLAYVQAASLEAPHFLGLEAPTQRGPSAIPVFDECLQAFETGNASAQAAVLTAVRTMAQVNDLEALRQLGRSAKTEYLKTSIEQAIDVLGKRKGTVDKKGK